MKHINKFISVALIFFLSINLFACKPDEPAPKTPKLPPDLSGQWKQVNSQFEDSYQGAIISGDKIEIYWVSNNGDTRSLYWSGSFDAPSTADEPYSWVSKNDTDRIASAALASRDETKEFTYTDNQITYSSSILGSTTKVRLEKQEWEPGLKIEDDVQPSEDIPEESEPVKSDEYGTFSLVIAGVEFSIPDYYKKDEEKSTNGEMFFWGNKGDMIALWFVEDFNEDHTEEKIEEELKKAWEIDLANKFNLKNAETSMDDISVGGLSGVTISVSGKEPDMSVNAAGRMEIWGNPEQKMFGIAYLMQLGNAQYDYFADYEKMIENARLIASGNAGNDPNLVPMSGIRPEFKKAMDSYEVFFDEYIAFMERYKNSNNSMDMLTDYTNYMSKYTETMTALSQINDGTLSTEELAYYAEVSSRITQKLLMVSQ